MKEKIANSIALHQMTINELKEIKHNIEQSIDENVKFNIETRHIKGGESTRIKYLKAS